MTIKRTTRVVSSRARSIALGKCARKTLMMAALSEQITTLVDRYNLGADEIRGVFTEKERAYIANVHERLSEQIIQAPVAPSTRSCSLYCATNPDGTGKCIYCGQPKAKHTKRARDPNRTGHAK